MSDNSISSGDGSGNLVNVSDDGYLKSTGRVEDYSAITTKATVTVAGGQLVAAREGRQGLWVQNGANPIHLSFSTTAAAATDWLVPAGGEFRSERFAYDGAIQAIAVGGNSNVIVIEMA